MRSVESPPDDSANNATSWLTTRTALILAVLAITAFQIAYEFEAAGGLNVVYLASLFRLAWVKSPRWAFYLGFLIGTANAAFQLQFFIGIFGPTAIGLWAILGLWTGLFVLLSRLVVGRWPYWGAAWLPVLWLGLEYFRSELYPLRFAWLTAGLALSHPNWVALTTGGVYGFSFFVLSVIAAFQIARRRPAVAVVASALPLMLALCASTEPEASPLVVGIQFEFASDQQILEALDGVARDEPSVDLVVLSEYTFDGDVPLEIRDWCVRHQKHLIAGGKDRHDGGTSYYNTAFVVSPKGEVVFKQAKSVPIQFMNDGLPAPSQQIWESPWGKIGIAICYDMSYARVIDLLVERGAQALVIPMMDAEDWGDHEHRLHAKVAPVRAREYGIPIFRLGSSGISQLVDRDGSVVASAPFPGQGQRLKGRLQFAQPGRLPVDRYLALPAVGAVIGLLGWLGFCRLRSA